MARAGTGVCYAYFDSAGAAEAWVAWRRRAEAVIEFAPGVAEEQAEIVAVARTPTWN